MIKFQPNFLNQANAPLPDPYTWTAFEKPPADFIVSRKRDGSVASYYKDLQWNWAAYTTNGRPLKFDFSSWIRGSLNEKRHAIIEEMRWLMFIIIWIKNGLPLSPNTLGTRFSLIRNLAKFADKFKHTISDILCVERVQAKFIAAYSGNALTELPRLLQVIFEAGENITGLKVCKATLLRNMQALAKRGQNDDLTRQFAPLPTKIYSALIKNLLKELSDFEVVADNFLDLVSECVAKPGLGYSVESQKHFFNEISVPFRTKDALPTLSVLLCERNLEHYFEAKSLLKSVRGLGEGLSDIQLICKLIIHTFSGIRDDEARTMPYACLETFITQNKTHSLLNGRTFKPQGGRAKRVRWVTSKEGARAVRMAQRIAKVIYKSLGDVPSSKLSKENDYPLFVSTGYLPFAASKPFSATAKYASGVLELTTKNGKFIKKFLSIRITDEDIAELELIDPHRAWRSEVEFAVGAIWPLSTHQLRRSLALYASSSGLVSLPTLRFQLKHITEEMASYYAAGSANAKNIIAGDIHHFGVEYQNTQPESQALSYISNVLLSDSRLFGAHGIWVENRQRSKNGGVLTLANRDDTMRRFKKGEMAFRATPLGGCTTLTACDKKAMRSTIACLDCNRAVIKLHKLQRVVRAQETLVNSLDPKSMEWRVENSDLAILLSAESKMLLKTL